ncbi:LysR family transcriptional regulator [Pseudomonas sp. 5P_5.1_Bac1]|uniref:LysR family transcriptional regulator n=1 Tax=Pseudomonas sp. 5P_5.1_Bac1 TaxID=2971616 RepID=UPI0021C6A035|nr:LysR family transcriptional regulator [Pseudomonas sp. 5P_5.1_Bac1]MCU1719710.1 LysR family transcriptional regulator [Pseudomonas sp. 5P_5.1_Bac1]
MTSDVLDNTHSDEIAAFLAVAGQGSFVAAGRLLQRHPTVVSKRVAAMEKRLGVRLIERSTRQVRVTPVGEKLEQRLRAAFGMIAEAEQQAISGASEVRGVLRLALPAAMGRLCIGPMLPAFLREYPQVSIVADYSERLVDIIEEGFDIAIRIGELDDNRLIAKKLCDHRRILCASPGYLQRHGVPHSPQQLAEHNCLRFSGLASFPQWRLYAGDQQHTVTPKGSLTANDSESLLAAARDDAGILGAGEWLMSRDMAAGRLVRVLPDWQLDPTGGVFLVRPSARFPAATVLAFKHWIEARFSPVAPWIEIKKSE